jgi:hypothetical protein
MTYEVTKRLPDTDSSNDDVVFYRNKYHFYRGLSREQENIKNYWEDRCSDQVQINNRALVNQNKVMQVRINELELTCSNKDAMVTKSDAMATKSLKKVVAMTNKNNKLKETVKTLEETVNTLKAKLESVTCN